MSFNATMFQKPGKSVILGLVAFTLLLQVSVLVVEFLGSVWPIWYGKAIVLETQPIDPRSLFRGNFVRLNFEINSITDDNPVLKTTIKKGAAAYVQLSEDQGIWHPTGISADKPDSGDFIRGRVRHINGNKYDFEYGIEAFFMPKDKALDLQNRVRSYAQFDVYIAPSGKSRVNSVRCVDEECTIRQNL